MTEQPEMTQGEEDVIAVKFQEMAERFAQLRNDRHLDGQKKYGVFTFMGNDVIRMMLEELADTANYCEYQAIKLQLLQELLEQDDRLKALGDDEQNITIGMQSFKGTKDVGWKK